MKLKVLNYCWCALCNVWFKVDRSFSFGALYRIKQMKEVLKYHCWAVVCITWFTDIVDKVISLNTIRLNKIKKYFKYLSRSVDCVIPYETLLFEVLCKIKQRRVIVTNHAWEVICATGFNVVGGLLSLVIHWRYNDGSFSINTLLELNKEVLKSYCCSIWAVRFKVGVNCLFLFDV